MALFHGGLHRDGGDLSAQHLGTGTPSNGGGSSWGSMWRLLAKNIRRALRLARFAMLAVTELATGTGTLPTGTPADVLLATTP